MGCARWWSFWVLFGVLAIFGGVLLTQREAPPLPLEQAPVEATTSEPVSYADVLFVRAVETAPETWTFSVTVAHPDEGWEHYADGWDVVLPDGTTVKPQPNAPFTRVLAHPHVDEQPFTRSASRIHIPADVQRVRVRAHDSRHGWGGREVVVDLGTAQGGDFEVQRLAGG